MEWRPLGDAALEADTPEAAAWAEAVRAAGLPGVVDAWAAFGRVAVAFEAPGFDPSVLEGVSPAAGSRLGREVVVPVLYDGPDLGWVCEKTGLTADQLVEAHSLEVQVLAVGFAPGFAYLGPVDARLQGLERLDRPRTAVPAGSVGLVGDQTCVYPGGTAGGWPLIGRTPLSTVDLAFGRFAFRAGDRVRFSAVDRAQFDQLVGRPL
jgi:KipI family sensor histidine kinase inhibitor